jgi:hypothetical protein
MTDLELQAVEAWHAEHTNGCACDDCRSAVPRLVAEVRRQREMLRSWLTIPFRDTYREQVDEIQAHHDRIAGEREAEAILAARSDA